MKTEILVSANFGVAMNGCWHLLLHYIHLTDAPFDFILPHIIVINKSITKILNQMRDPSLNWSSATIHGCWPLLHILFCDQYQHIKLFL